MIQEYTLDPQDLQAERAFLCSCMIDNDILSLTIVKKECFYREENKMMFAAMQSLQRSSAPIDAITIANESNLNPDFILEVSMELMTSSSWKAYEEILLEKMTKRNLKKMAMDIINSGDDKHSDDILLNMKKLLNSMDSVDSGISGYDLIINTIEDITTEQNNICDYGYKLMDKVLGGYKGGQLIVIGGRPGFGKTALIIELLQRILQQDVRATVYSLEMSNSELIKRLITNWSSVNMRDLNKEENLNIIAESSNDKIDVLKNAMFYDKIFDFNALERSIRRGSIVKGHKVIFIDHLGLIRSNSKQTNRNQEIGYMTATLKTLAKELGIAIVVLSQLNRNVEKRNDEPELSDLRDSGSIEQDADVVMMLHREKDGEGHYDNTIFDILIRKNRNGNLSRLPMSSDLGKMRIGEIIQQKKK